MSEHLDKILDAVLTNDQVKARKAKKAPVNRWAVPEKDKGSTDKKKKVKPAGTLKLTTKGFKFGGKKKTKPKSTKKRGKK